MSSFDSISISLCAREAWNERFIEERMRLYSVANELKEVEKYLFGKELLDYCILLCYVFPFICIHSSMNNRWCIFLLKIMLLIHVASLCLRCSIIFWVASSLFLSHFASSNPMHEGGLNREHPTTTTTTPPPLPSQYHFFRWSELGVGWAVESC